MNKQTNRRKIKTLSPDRSRYPLGRLVSQQLRRVSSFTDAKPRGFSPRKLRVKLKSKFQSARCLLSLFLRQTQALIFVYITQFNSPLPPSLPISFYFAGGTRGGGCGGVFYCGQNSLSTSENSATSIKNIFILQGSLFFCNYVSRVWRCANRCNSRGGTNSNKSLIG